MSAVDISLFDLLNVSIGTPEVGAVNFNALHSLLHAILGHLKIQNVTTHWREENHPPQEPRSQSQSKAPLRELPGPYHHMEDKLRKIELKMSALEKLPNGPELMNMCRSESSATPVSDMWQQIQIRRQVQANEDGVSKAMALIQDLLREIQDLKELRDSMKEEIMNLQERLDQMHMDKVSTSLEDVEKCCHRVDNLETVMRHLGERVSQFPAPGELEQCVTWDIMQSTLVNERQTRENEVPDSPQMPCPQPPAPPSTRPTLPTSTTATTISLPTTPRSPTTSTPTSTKPDASRNAPPETAPEAGAASPQRSLSDCAVVPLSRVSSGAERYPETVHALRVVGRLGEKQDHLEARVERLEAGVERLEAGAEACKTDHAQLQHLREQLTNMGNRDTPDNLLEQIHQLRSLLDSLMNDREKPRGVEEVQVRPQGGAAGKGSRQESQQEEEPQSNQGDSGEIGQLRMHIGYLRKSVHQLTEEVELLKNWEQNREDTHLQDQMDNLRGLLEQMMASSTSLLSSSLQQSKQAKVKGPRAGLDQGRGPKADLDQDRGPGAGLDQDRGPGAGLDQDRGPGAGLDQDRGPGAGLDQDRGPGAGLDQDRGPGAGLDQDRGPGAGQEGFAACPSCSLEVSKQISQLFQRYDKLQGLVSNLTRQGGGRAAPGAESTEMISELQGAILQLQAECEKLHTTASTLMEEHNQKQKHIEHLYKSMEKLEEKKADRELVEMEIEIKADKRALESKVSRMQFDSMTEQLSSMFQDLLGKISGQEQDWHKVLDKISSEMECKLNRVELDSVKQQLEERWKAIRKQLQAQPGPELDDAAGIRRQLVSRFHCISCDRPVDMMTPGQNLLTVPSAPSLPSHKSSRPYTVYELEQVRQHCRSLRPGTNQGNFALASSERSLMQIHRVHTMLCEQIERVQSVLACPGRPFTQPALRELSLSRHPPLLGPLPRTSQSLIKHDHIPEMADYSYLAMSRSCGGSHTLTFPNRRYTRLQHISHIIQTEEETPVNTPLRIQPEEVDILGLDGHIYKGRLNKSVKTVEGRLPIISPGVSKSKDKLQCSPSQKSGGTLGSGRATPVRPQSAKTQRSRSTSSTSVRDRPVSSLVCLSQDPLHQASSLADLPGEVPPSLEVSLDLEPAEDLPVSGL